MEEYTKIEDYLLLNNDNNIEKHRSTPFSGILLLAGGIILIPLGLHAAMSDIIQMTRVVYCYLQRNLEKQSFYL